METELLQKLAEEKGEKKPYRWKSFSVEKPSIFELNLMIIGAEKNWALSTSDQEVFVTMSSTYKTNKGEYANDGDPSTYASTLEQLNAWIQIDIPENIEFRKIIITGKKINLNEYNKTIGNTSTENFQNMFGQISQNINPKIGRAHV